MRRKYWKQNNNKPWKGPNGFTKKQRENKGRKKEKDKKRQKKTKKDKKKYQADELDCETKSAAKLNRTF